MTEFSLEDLSAAMGLAVNRTGMFAEGEFNGWHGIKSRLTEFAQLPNAYQMLESVFDIQDHKVARTTLNEWREGVFSHLPTVSVLTDVEMQGALGAYSAERRSIYLAESIASIDSITGKVLAEEFGHELDNHFNGVIDTSGDEGDLFSRILFGIGICTTDLSNLMSEDDKGFIVSNHRCILVERSQVAIESMGGLLYQTQRGTDSKIYTRSSTDGRTWTAWHEAGGVTHNSPSLASLNGRLYQSHRGTDGKIYTRSSAEGINWSSWHEAGGVTESSLAMAAANGLLYQSHRGLDNNIYTRFSSNGVNWSNWHEAGGKTDRAPALTSLNGRLYQTIKGIDSKIYTRSSANGTSWTNWHEAGGVTHSQPALEAANGRLYQSHRGTDNQIYTRSSTDGTNWTNWHQAGGVTDFAPSIASHNGRLYQTHRGLDNLIYTRSSTDGVNWDSWAAGTTTNSSSYRVDRLNSDGNEGHRHTFKIFRTGNTSIAGQVRFSTSSDSATSDVDFSSYSAVRNFAPGQTEDVVYVDSRADNLNEGTERFNATISKVNSADTITTASTFGQIFNVNSASSYRVDRLNSDGNEGHRHTFTIFRTGNTSIAGQVRFSTSSDSATSDVDFSSYSAVRNFAPGQTEDVVYVDSRTDNVNEGTERFNATISKVNSADTITTASTFGQIFNVAAPSAYANNLSSWSDSQWNWAAGDETRITGVAWPGSRDERNYPEHSSILQVYNDLSTKILGKAFPMTAGYVLDEGYRYDPIAGGKYGWHEGIDIDTPGSYSSPSKTITNVRALVGGEVEVIINQKGNYFLLVSGDDGRFYRYGHLNSFVKSTGRVNAGDVIGEVGVSRSSNHLHFVVSKQKRPPAGHDPFNQNQVYGWTLNPLRVFWQLRREGRV